MLRVQQIREIFNITNPTVYRWIKSGKLPTPKYINNIRVWNESEIEEARLKLLKPTTTTKPTFNKEVL